MSKRRGLKPQAKAELEAFYAPEPTADDYILAAEALYHYAACKHRRVVCQPQQDAYEYICAKAKLFREMAKSMKGKHGN